MLKRVVVKGFYKDLLFGIVIVLLLLGVCVSVDYADDSPINNINNSTYNINTSRINVANNTGVLEADDDSVSFTGKNSDKIHTIREKSRKNVRKLPTISMWAKPSVRCGYAYRWYYRTFVDYCPNCGHYNCLLKNPKGVPENEYTCKYCDSDFDGVVGKEKYSWSNVYLRKA